MSSISAQTVIDIVAELFTEAFEGAQGPWTWFVNNEPGCGIFGTIEPLSAAQASRPLVDGGRSIAAHVEHLRWWLANVNGVARGGEWNPDWSESWSVWTVDEEQWRGLRTALRREFDLVLQALPNPDQDWSDRMVLTGILAMAPHAAHHLGTIRLMAKQIVG